jgi:DNA-binding transcriptional ArsR family regulator
MQEETIITHMLGNSPKVKILDLLIIGRRLQYSITDMAEHAGVGRATIYRMLDSMLNDKILVKKGKYGRIQLYQLNMENPEVKLLVKFFDEVAKIESEKEIARQTLKIKVKAAKN